MKETGSPKTMSSTKEEMAEATERRPGELSEPGRSGGASATKLATPDKICQPILVPNPEVLEKPMRRRFTAEYKLRILQEVDALSGKKRSNKAAGKPWSVGNATKPAAKPLTMR